ncbi:hypothetical protein DICPUDRAFT_147586 [Dictyostelium purpureum]|uniref:Uncharacterized protein n=1 Tax=Dictyostelium purpureum TaxID=5786 RepID=F0Z8V9_DICPU|nr:uncharacterized protein DICPUDRAFT_147586 [Dictyostelium purpureum]EGC39645.1 hypothetical protein DICPUDRAFT_147586 [Dictyostelium purpureum]|eukprot:XP_003283866.1 hypothetical protein DICPUDRAFT_147586 [Dictyostelium purpureum]
MVFSIEKKYNFYHPLKGWSHSFKVLVTPVFNSKKSQCPPLYINKKNQYIYRKKEI